ncbi:TauD/TfdA family dioxygenase [Streptomyces sp. ISL-98]|nr:TauD/TfdA family dioxygenase [Streptomyces sp. ISL-98]
MRGWSGTRASRRTPTTAASTRTPTPPSHAATCTSTTTRPSSPSARNPTPSPSSPTAGPNRAARRCWWTAGRSTGRSATSFRTCCSYSVPRSPSTAGTSRPPAASPVVWALVFEQVDGRVHVRCNVKRMETAAELTGEQLPPDRHAALDTLRKVLARPELRITILLEDGDCLIVDDRRILHGRMSYEDHGDAARRCCLVRVMLRRHRPGHAA